MGLPVRLLEAEQSWDTSPLVSVLVCVRVTVCPVCFVFLCLCVFVFAYYFACV